MPAISDGQSEVYNEKKKYLSSVYPFGGVYDFGCCSACFNAEMSQTKYWQGQISKRYWQGHRSKRYRQAETEEVLVAAEIEEVLAGT